MLEQMRNASKGWLAGILIFLLVASFGIWGVQDAFTVSNVPKIATVGDEDINPDQFQREFARFLKQMERDSEAKLSSTEAKALGLDREALERMVMRKALMKKAEEIGLSVSHAQVVSSLAAVPGLGDGRGGLDPSRLQQILQQNDFSEKEFIELVRGDMLREQLIRTILGGAQMPSGMEAALNHYRLERRVAEYVLIEPSRGGEIKDPDDAALRKFYEAHAKEKYGVAELRSVTLVTARLADVGAQVVVTDEEVKKVYDNNKRFYQTPEKRTLEQIRFKTEAKARSAKKKLDGGETIAAVALGEGYKPEDIKLGEVSKTDPIIPAVAFEIPVNSVSEPVKGAFGWVILRVLAVTPGSEKSFDEVKAEIREKFVAERSKEKLFERTSEFEDTLGGGATLEEAAKKHGLPVIKVAAMDARGNDANGVGVEGLPGGDFVQRVFLSEAGIDSELHETPDGVYFNFRVDKVSPASKKPFDQIRADVLADWRNEELTSRLKKIAADLVKRGNGGEAMSSIAASLGVAAIRTEPMPRFGKTAIFSEAAVTATSEAKRGEFFSGPVADGKSIIVGRLAEISYVPEPTDAALRQAYLQQVRQSFASDLALQFSNTVRDQIGVTIDEARFTAFHNGE